MEEIGTEAINTDSSGDKLARLKKLRRKLLELGKLMHGDLREWRELTNYRENLEMIEDEIKELKFRASLNP